jgi:hypothetical protein
MVHVADAGDFLGYQVFLLLWSRLEPGLGPGLGGQASLGSKCSLGRYASGSPICSKVMLLFANFCHVALGDIARYCDRGTVSLHEASPFVVIVVKLLP